MRPPEMPVDDYKIYEFGGQQKLVGNVRNTPYAVKPMLAAAMMPWRARTQMMSVRGLTDMANMVRIS
jgi:hypothetical protein